MAEQSLIIAKRYEGNVASAAVILDYDPEVRGRFWTKVVEGFRFVMAFLSLLRKESLPKFSVDKRYRTDFKHFEKKMSHMEHMLKKWHLEEGPPERHWYIQIVGVAPEYNGRGFGRELMEKVGDLADEVGTSCYLECGASNVPFYQKMGYSIWSEKTVEDPLDKKAAPLDVFIMVRRPSSQKA